MYWLLNRLALNSVKHAFHMWNVFLRYRNEVSHRQWHILEHKEHGCPARQHTIQQDYFKWAATKGILHMFFPGISVSSVLLMINHTHFLICSIFPYMACLLSWFYKKFCFYDQITLVTFNVNYFCSSQQQY